MVLVCEIFVVKSSAQKLRRLVESSLLMQWAQRFARFKTIPKWYQTAFINPSKTENSEKRWCVSFASKKIRCFMVFPSFPHHFPMDSRGHVQIPPPMCFEIPWSPRPAFKEGSSSRIRTCQAGWCCVLTIMVGGWYNFVTVKMLGNDQY